MAKFLSYDENENKRLPIILETVKDKGKDAYYFMQIIPNKINDVKEIIYIVKNGYPRYATWDFGYWLIKRSADIAAFLKKQKYMDTPKDWFSNLVMCEKVFRGYESYIEGNLPLCLYRIRENEELKNAWETGEKEAKKLFLKWWMWYGENIFINDNRPLPIGKVESSFSKTKKRAKQNLCCDDIVHLAYQESKMMSEMLQKWAFEGISYSENYYQSGKELYEKSENWEKKRLPMWLEYELKSRDKAMRTAIPEEIGLDYAAWKCDIYLASSIFKEFSEWHGPVYGSFEDEDTLSQKESMNLIMPVESKVFEREINKEVLKCWEWIGKNIAGMWD